MRGKVLAFMMGIPSVLVCFLDVELIRGIAGRPLSAKSVGPWELPLYLAASLLYWTTAVFLVVKGAAPGSRGGGVGRGMGDRIVSFILGAAYPVIFFLIGVPVLGWPFYIGMVVLGVVIFAVGMAFLEAARARNRAKPDATPPEQ